jgi:hypothetical protein
MQAEPEFKESNIQFDSLTLSLEDGEHFEQLRACAAINLRIAHPALLTYKEYAEHITPW